MFVTDGLRKKVNDILLYMDERADFLTELRSSSSGWEDDRPLRWAAERALHVAIECVTDVASLVIDTLVMRDPANYQDMLRVLEDEKVVTTAWFEAFVTVFDVRSRLVRDYIQLQPAEIRRDVHQYAPLFRDYGRSVRTYLHIPE